jgi:Carboxypeptidase regulatory-like domain
MKPAATRVLQALAIVVFATMVLLAPATARAQEARGAITGKVVDAGRAVIQGATVKVTNVAMGTTLTLRTNEDGFYQAPYLIPGTYQMTAEANGFKRYVREGIVVQVNDNIQIDIELEVGTVDQTVTVTADAPLLNTTNASMGTVVDSRRVAELPIPHGEPFKLIGLAGGASYVMNPRLDRPFEPTHIVGYTINGTRSNRSDITIDGVPSTSTANAGEVIASFVPPQDLIQEFKVQTATFDASFGNTEGGVTNLSIKSGTNSFHGTAAYSKMPKSLFANDFYGNATNTPLADFNYTRWGGTVGGPVWVPKLYNGRNKTFFMYGIEGIPEARPRNNGEPTIPSEKMRTGDFTELLAANAGYQLYNPFSATRSGSTVVRVPFRCDAAGNPLPVDAQKRQDQSAGIVCNKIPSALINPVARKFVDTFLPLPTSIGALNGRGNFAQPDLTEKIEYLSNTIRIDHVVSEKHRIFGRASWYDRDSNYNNYYRNAATGEWFLFKSRQGAFDHVWLVSPTVVVNSRYGYNRFIRGTNSNPENRGIDLTSLGFPAYYNNLIPEDTRRFPRFDFNNPDNPTTAAYQGTGIGGELRPTDTHAINSTVNHTVGAHAFKYGAEFRSYRETDRFFQNDMTGQFVFNNTWTRSSSTATTPDGRGHSFASFLMGLPASGVIQQRADYAEQSTTTGIFFHDDWKVNPRLTINMGLRYEVEGALTDRYNRSVSGFDFAAVQPIEAAARTRYAANPTPEVAASQFNVRGGLLFPSVNGAGRGVYETPKKNFMPRFGFAYRLNEKTVARGGYGIFFGFLGQRRGDVNQIGFSTNTAMTVSLDNGLTFIETLSNPFAAFQSGLSQPRGAADGIQTFLGQSITYFNPKPLSPYNQRYELSLQRELPGGWVAEIAYVGNRGTHIEVNRNLNVTPQKYLSKTGALDTTTNDYLNADLPNPFAGLMPDNAIAALRGTTIDRFRLLRPFPQFDAVNTTTNEGYSWYHSLQLNMNKRFSQGYTLGLNYTFSKFMQATEFLNGDDLLPTEVISDADRPHRFSLSGIYELPFGKGRKLFADVNKVASYVISGWQISSVYQYQSGAPIGFGNIFFTGNFRDIALSGDEQSLTRWFNTDAGFVKVTPVSNIRTFPFRFPFVRTDTINNLDFSVIKKTEILENKNVEFRAELLNAFNHVLFPGPDTNVTGAAFGTIVPSTQANYPRRIQVTLKLTF